MIPNNHNKEPIINEEEKEAFLVPEAGVSSRLPEWHEVSHAMFECALCAAGLICLVWIALVVIVSLLLSYGNTPAVRHSCAGFWDFMLVSTLSPAIIPTLYCLLSCCGCWAWQPFSGGCMLIMGVACLHLTITCSENGACMDAIRSTTPPLPWYVLINKAHNNTRILSCTYHKRSVFSLRGASCL